MNPATLSPITLDPLALKSFIPLGILILTAILSMLMGASDGEHAGDKGRVRAFWTNVVGISVAMLAGLTTLNLDKVELFEGVIYLDSFTRHMHLVILGATLFVTFITRGHDQDESLLPEIYSLYCFAAAGMLLMVSTFELVFMFVALEVMSLAIYILVALKRQSRMAAESGLKYFVLGGAASAVLLYGTALLYGVTGTFSMRAMASLIASNPSVSQNPIFIIGLLFVTVGLLFKVGAFPFHVWIPDVYSGAAIPVTGFMTSAVKVTAFMALSRVISMIGLAHNSSFAPYYHDILWVVAAITMLFGNIVAVAQTNLKKMLAYSTIAHTGYLLLGPLAARLTTNGYFAMGLYLIFYCIMNLGTFAILAQISKVTKGRLDLEDINGLGLRSPLLGVGMTVFLLAMAGIPMTSGFIGKYYLFSAAVEAKEIPLVVIAALASAISIYYYLRVLVHLYMKEPSGSNTAYIPQRLVGAMAIVVISIILTVQFGVVPRALIEHFKAIL